MALEGQYEQLQCGGWGALDVCQIFGEQYILYGCFSRMNLGVHGMAWADWFWAVS